MKKYTPCESLIRTSQQSSPAFSINSHVPQAVPTPEKKFRSFGNGKYSELRGDFQAAPLDYLPNVSCQNNYFEYIFQRTADKEVVLHVQMYAPNKTRQGLPSKDGTHETQQKIIDMATYCRDNAPYLILLFSDKLEIIKWRNRKPYVFLRWFGNNNTKPLPAIWEKNSSDGNVKQVYHHDNGRIIWIQTEHAFYRGVEQPTSNGQYDFKRYKIDQFVKVGEVHEIIPISPELVCFFHQELTTHFISTVQFDVQGAKCSIPSQWVCQKIKAITPKNQTITIDPLTGTSINIQISGEKIVMPT